MEIAQDLDQQLLAIMRAVQHPHPVASAPFGAAVRASESLGLFTPLPRLETLPVGLSLPHEIRQMLAIFRALFQDAAELVAALVRYELLRMTNIPLGPLVNSPELDAAITDRAAWLPVNTVAGFDVRNLRGEGQGNA